MRLLEIEWKTIQLKLSYLIDLENKKIELSIKELEGTSNELVEDVQEGAQDKKEVKVEE